MVVGDCYDCECLCFGLDGGLRCNSSKKVTVLGICYATCLRFSYCDIRYAFLPLQKIPLMKKLIPLIAICILLGCRETEIEKG